MPRKENQRYTPRQFVPLTGPLFDLAEPETCCDRIWLRILQQDIAVALESLVVAIGRLYRETPPDRVPKLSGAAMGRIQAYCHIISQRLDREVSAETVESILWRFLRTCGYVIDDPEPGPRRGWPLLVRKAIRVDDGDDPDAPQTLFDNVLEDVARAVRGIYPSV